MQDTIHIALCIHDPGGNYSPHAGATLASVLSHTSSPVCAHIVHNDTLSVENKSKLQAVAQRFDKEIRFYQIELPEEIGLLGGMWTQGALFRYLLPDLVDVPKIIYLDCDIIVDLNIIELWEIDLQDYPLAAALDPGIPGCFSDGQMQIYQRIGLPLHNYFNNGLLVLNLDYLRKKYQLFRQITDYLQRYPKAPCLDQDAINWLFQDNYLQLDARFNSFTEYTGTDKYHTPAIWHIHDPGGKAWQFYATPMHILYWKALALTPWQDTLLERFLEVMNRTMTSIQGNIHYSRRTCNALVENLAAEMETLQAAAGKQPERKHSVSFSEFDLY